MFLEPVFSKYQWGFRKGQTAQHCLLTMTEKWKKCLDSNGVCGALLTDLPKAFGCLPHSLLIAKRHVYRFDKTSTECLKDYLNHRKWNIKINMFSNWTNILHGVHQGSILGPLLFNPLSPNPTKWSNTLKQFIGNSRRIVWVCLTILWDWRLKVKLPSFLIPVFCIFLKDGFKMLM